MEHHWPEGDPIPDMASPHLDLGDGYFLRWVRDSKTAERIGAFVYHRSDHPAHPDHWCVVTPYWKGREVLWTLDGLADDHLTLSPSIRCVACNDHGFIRNGKWVRA